MTQPTKAKSKLADSTSKPQIGDRGSSITAADVAHSFTDADGSLGATSQAEIEADLDLLGVAINACVSALEAHGLIADN